MSVNCSATMMGSNDRKLKAGSSSSKPLSSCVAKGQPMCSPAEIIITKNIFSQHCLDLSSTWTQLLHFLCFQQLILSLTFSFTRVLLTETVDDFLSLNNQTVLHKHYNMWADIVSTATWSACSCSGGQIVCTSLWSHSLSPCPVVPVLSCLHTIRIRLTLLSAVEVGQQVAGAALQVRAGEVEVKVGQELVQTVVVRRTPEVLGVLVQPGAQDGRHSAAKLKRTENKRGNDLNCKINISYTSEEMFSADFIIAGFTCSRLFKPFLMPQRNKSTTCFAAIRWKTKRDDIACNYFGLNSYKVGAHCPEAMLTMLTSRFSRTEAPVKRAVKG